MSEPDPVSAPRWLQFQDFVLAQTEAISGLFFETKGH